MDLLGRPSSIGPVLTKTLAEMGRKGVLVHEGDGYRQHDTEHVGVPLPAHDCMPLFKHLCNTLVCHEHRRCLSQRTGDREALILPAYTAWRDMMGTYLIDLLDGSTASANCIDGRKVLSSAQRMAVSRRKTDVLTEARGVGWMSSSSGADLQVGNQSWSTQPLKQA
jgi:hypothetical protein